MNSEYRNCDLETLETMLESVQERIDLAMARGDEELADEIRAAVEEIRLEVDSRTAGNAI